MPKNDSHFKQQPVSEVLTSIDQSIRQMLLDTGFGELHLEFEPTSNHQYIQIVLKDTVHNFYAVPVEDIRQLLRSGPHFPEHYVSAKLWHTLGTALNTILGVNGTSHGQIRVATEQRRHQQLFRVSGGTSHQFYEDRTGMNL
ncbi:MAG: hypothetical protein F6K11_24010 [Leptolyngbya sp. SIO3F4]|nr:hypothetical protein [Leptolyngbya sp. SIO3F4]